MTFDIVRLASEMDYAGTRCCVLFSVSYLAVPVHRTHENFAEKFIHCDTFFFFDLSMTCVKLKTDLDILKYGPIHKTKTMQLRITQNLV